MLQERTLLKAFIETYKCLPCLWDSQDQLYLHKGAREQAYEILMEKYKAMVGEEGDTSLDDMKKKIDNLRGAYRREFKKVLKERSRGLVYVPKLWYYDLMSFLDGHNKDISVEISLSDIKNFTSNSYTSGEEDIEFHVTHTQSQQDQSHLSFDEEFELPPSKKSKDDSMSYVVETLEPDILEDHHNSAEESIQEMSEPESFGRTVGLQLKELNQMQRTIAEKLISEVIFYGRLDRLTLASSLHINEKLYQHD